MKLLIVEDSERVTDRLCQALAGTLALSIAMVAA